MARRKIMKGRGFGFFGNIGIGIIGSLIGGFLFRLLGISACGWVGSLVTALAGALLLLWILRSARK
jgi:uncharacterized membrane protein YeaQ/YmgE (transglycosylase-associated protein family)